MERVDSKSMREKSANNTTPISLDPDKRSEKHAKIFLLLLLYLPCFFLHTDLDNDIWFLLNSGRYVLQNGIPYIEPFSMHQNMSFIMQQWFTAVIYWGAYSKLGIAGLLAIVFLVFACIISVVYQLAKYLSKGNFIASFLAAFLTALLLTPFLVSRPILFTLLILICELYLLERYIGEQKIGYLIPLPILSALLVNMHAARWPVQFVLLLPYVIDSFRFRVLMVEGQGYDKRFFFPAILLMFAAGFANPYGIGAMTYLFRSYGYTEINQVNEMMPANINNVLGILIFATFFLVGAIYFLKKNGKTRLRYVLLTMGTAVLALSSTRSFVLFVVCSMFPLAYWLKDIKLPENKIKTQKGTLVLRVVLIVLVSLELVYALYSRAVKVAQTEVEPPVAGAVHYLLASESPENVVLYTGYDDGGYAEFMGFRPYIDPRAEVFVQKNNKARDIMKEYYLLQAGGLYYKELLDEYHFTHLVVSDYDILHTYLPYDSDYRLVYDDGEYFVYQHN